MVHSDALLSSQCVESSLRKYMLHQFVEMDDSVYFSKSVGSILSHRYIYLVAHPTDFDVYYLSRKVEKVITQI